jgi:hypothetical protein
MKDLLLAKPVFSHTALDHFAFRHRYGVNWLLFYNDLNVDMLTWKYIPSLFSAWAVSLMRRKTTQSLPNAENISQIILFLAIVPLS